MISVDDTEQLPPPCQFFTEQQDCEDYSCCWYESSTNVSQSSCDDCLQTSLNNDDASIILIMWAALILMFSMVMVFGFIRIIMCLENNRRRRRIRQQQLFFLQMGLLYPRNERVFALAIVQRVESSPEISTQELPVAAQIPENIVIPESFAVREFDV